jgi:hypothetical protein
MVTLISRKGQVLRRDKNHFILFQNLAKPGMVHANDQREIQYGDRQKFGENLMVGWW